MLGSGLFVLPGLAAGKTGPSVWLAYLFSGLCVLPAALSKAELATAMPTSGGTYVFIDRSFGPLAGTISGIGLWLSLLLKSSFALVGFSAYLYVLDDIPSEATALGALALIVLINIRGVRKVSQVQSIVVGLAIVGLSALFVIAFRSYDPRRLEPMFTGGGGGFLAAAGFVFVSYAGVTKIAAFAEEVKNPERNLPWGMLLSLGIAMLLYGGITLMLVACVPMFHLESDLHPIYTLAQTIGGHPLGIGAAVLGVVTMISMANGGLMAASRFPFAMSRDSLLPGGLHYLHERFLTPVVSIALSGAVIAAAILFIDVERLAKLASAFLIMLYIAENVVVIVLREAGAQWYKPTYRSPFYPWMQAFGILSSLMLLVVMGPIAIAAGIAIAVPGLALFLTYGRKRTARRGVVGIRGRRRELLRPITQEIPVVTDYTEGAAVVVALFGTERTPELLVEHGAALAEGGSVRVAYVLEVPEQLALAAMKDDRRSRSVKRRVEAMAETQGVPLSFETIISRDIVKTISDLSTRTRCQWLVMEWAGRARGTFTFRNPLGWLKAQLSCNLAVFHDAGIRHIRKILVYAEPGPHDALVTRTADYLAEIHGATLTFIRFVPTDAPRTRSTTEADYLDQVRQLCRTPSETLLVSGRNEAEAIGKESVDFDLLVMAEPTESLASYLFGGGRDKLTAAAACSVLRVQTPRAETHRALQQTPRDQSPAKLADLLDRRSVVARIDRHKKDALFDLFARTFSEHLPGLEPNDIVTALHDRERTQNTAVGFGVALPHATLEAADRTYLGVFTASEPIDYEAPDGEGVDIFFVTIGPPSERQTHLYLLASVSRLVLQTSLLHELRKASEPAEIIAAMESRIRELGV